MTLNGDIKFSDLSNFKLLGKGIFGIVYKALYLGTEVAVKECLPLLDQPGYNLEKYFNREVTILKECRHPNIVQYMGTCIHDNKFYIVTEYIKNDNLKTWITERLDELSWKLRVNFAIDIARAMAYLHSKNIIHRDIKPENLLITENGRVKICDFGFSRFDARTEEEKRHLSYCGTEAYMAPEIILCMDFDMTVDIFGYGVILCELISGNIAENAFKRKIPGFEIDSNDIKSYAEKDPLCPENFVKLAIQCTDYERLKRPSWIEIINILNEIDENISDNYNIGIIPASELLSNDFFIPISPMIKGQSIKEYNKAASIKSLNIDVDEEKINHQEKCNGRPTSPVLNTKRLSNQYYYYYAVNNPSSGKNDSNVYRRLPAYISPPLEHSSFIAIPKEMAINDSINIYSNKNESKNNNNSRNYNNSKNKRNSINISESNSSNKSNGKSDNISNKKILNKSKGKRNSYIYKQYKLSSSSEPKNSTYIYDSDSEDQKDTQSNTNLTDDQNQILTSISSFASASSSQSSSSSFSITSNYSINNLSSNDVNTLINTYNNSNASLNKIYKINKSNNNSNCSYSGSISGNDNGSSSYSDSSNNNIYNNINKSSNKNNSRKDTLDKYKNENKRILFGEILFSNTSSTVASTSDMSDFSKSLKTLQSNTSTSFINESNSSIKYTSQKPILICSKNSIRKKNIIYENSVGENKENENITDSEDNIIPSSLKNNGKINNEKETKKEKRNIIKKSSINYKNKKSNKKVTIKDTDINNNQALENKTAKSYSGIHHRFSINYFPNISKCNVCNRRMNLVKRHLSCDDCNFRCHAKCSALAPFTCIHKK